MLKITFLGVLCLCTVGVSAQFDFGVKFGVASSYVDFNELEENTSIRKITGNNAVGWQAGFITRVSLLAIYVQPEILYSRLYSEIEISKSDGSTQTEQFDLSRLDVPVSIGFKIGAASISGGPVMSYNLNHASEILDVDYRDGTLGYQVGVGLTFGKFMIDLEYEGSFQNLADQVVIDGNAYKVDARTGQFLLGIGYSFF